MRPSPGPRRVLVLGGSSEASQLARQLSQLGFDLEVIVSFAGRTTSRNRLPDSIKERVGGFGGVEGLGRYLEEECIDAVIDATHPFADQMPFHVRAASNAAGVAALRLLRPPWKEMPGDEWLPVEDMAGAAQAVEASGARRVLLTIGRHELPAFAACSPAIRFVVRSIDPPVSVGFANIDVVLARGPFALPEELELIRSANIELVVSKNSGGQATSAKLDAARQLSLPVVMVTRPPCPPGDTVATPEAALKWLAAQLEETRP